MINAAATRPLQEAQEGLCDLLLGVLPPDGSTIGSQAAQEALSRVAERPINEDEYEGIKSKALSLGLVRKCRGRGCAIGLAAGSEVGIQQKQA